MTEAERLASLSDEELINEAAATAEAADLEELADLIVKRLSASVIPSSFPAEVGVWIRHAHEHGARMWRHIIPMDGPSCMCAEYRFSPDGTLQLELQDTNGCMFWRGTFRPAEERKDA